MELLLGQDNPKVRHGHVMSIYMVAVFLRNERIFNMADCELMVEEIVSDMPVSPNNFTTSYCLRVELVRFLEGVRRDGDGKRGDGHLMD
jgi:hypothetical protein